MNISFKLINTKLLTNCQIDKIQLGYAVQVL